MATTTRSLWAAALLILPLPAFAVPVIDAGAVQEAFDDFGRVCRGDGGKLWGESLCGPLLLVDPASRAFVANQLPAGTAGLYVGVLPPEQLVANTALQWEGTTWAQLRWPLPEDPLARRVLLVHEAFHRVQERLGMKAVGNGNAHLDSLEGRVLLQLEWRALQRALSVQGAARQGAVEDALTFRAARRSRFPGSEKEEQTLETYEGLAEYTGVRLASPQAAQRRALAAARLDEGARKASFVRSFAYASGPAYGLLLDEAGGSWRPRARVGADLGELLRTALSLPAPAADTVLTRSGRYGGAALREREAAREAEAQARVAGFRRALVEGPVLHLPLQKMKVEFDPNTLVPLEAAGTVYPTARIVDVWGTLSVTGGGVRVASDWKAAYVAAPTAGAAKGGTLSGEGWTLQLAPGWSAQPGARAGDLQLRAVP